MKIIDVHSHIDFVSHKYQSDVVGTICCAKNESEWGALMDEIKNDKCLRAAFGIHPWFVDCVDMGYENRLTDLLKTDSSFMIGETGLDKYHPNMDKQIDVFVKQLEIAIQLKRVVFLHCVGAWDKILHILKQYKKYELPIIVAHSFNGGIDIIDNLLKNYDVYFSFNKIDKARDSSRIAHIPIDKILLETDAKQNIILHDVMDEISEIKNDKNAPNIIYNSSARIFNNG